MVSVSRFLARRDVPTSVGEGGAARLADARPQLPHTSEVTTGTHVSSATDEDED